MPIQSLVSNPSVETQVDSANSQMSVMPPSAKLQLRIEFIDFARAICALWVMFAHLIAFRYGAAPQDQLISLILTANVHEAVTAFICLSGFSLFIPIARNSGNMRESIWTYFVSRALRILPPYYIALAAGAYITYRLQSIPHSLFMNEFFDHAYLTQDFHGDVNLVVPPLWS